MIKTKKRPEVRPDGNKSIQQKLATIRTEMASSLIEREEEIDIVLTALVVQEHPLLVGPPGTAKSMLLDALLKCMAEGTKEFSILFNKFTTPEEVFGPISVMGLKQDVYRRVTTNKLPEADLAFADEIFKASTAILNTMLRILNERTYENGDGSFRKCPLKLCVAASNEWPGEDGKELGALFDRFLFRKKVRPIATEAGRNRLLFGSRNHMPQFSVELEAEEIMTAYKTAIRMPWTDEAKEGMIKIIHEIRAEGINPGDRRQFKSVKAVQGYAYLMGSEEVVIEHLDILQHTLWDDPQEQPEKVAKIICKIANPTGHILNDLLQQMEDVIRRCTATEAVPKLKHIKAGIEQLPDHPKKDLSLQIISMNIKTAYDKVIG